MRSFSILKAEARQMLEAGGCHDWSHVERVYRLCMHIGKEERADLEILGMSAVLHDIGRKFEDRSNGRICHAEKGALLARRLMKKHGVNKEKIDKVAHCIESHRYRGNKKPETKEAKILFDADKLDSIGAIGIGRAFLFAGEMGAKLHNKGVDIEKTKSYTKEDTAYREFIFKLRKVKDKMMTVEGRKLAKNRHEFMVRFFKRLNKEFDGEI